MSQYYVAIARATAAVDGRDGWVVMPDHRIGRLRATLVPIADGPLAVRQQASRMVRLIERRTRQPVRIVGDLPEPDRGITAAIEGMGCPTAAALAAELGIEVERVSRALAALEVAT